MTEPAPSLPSPRFLIVRLGSLGDVIHGIPVAAALRRTFPSARIDWLVAPAYLDVLALVPCIDGRLGVNPRGPWSALVHCVRALRRSHYDAVIDIQGLVKSAVLARVAGALRTIGFARAHVREPLAAMFYTERIHPGETAHVITRNLALLAPLGMPEPRIEFPLVVRSTPVSDIISARVDAGAYALLNPGAAWPNKRWPPDRFGSIAAVLRDRFGLRSLVLWGPGEVALAERVVAASGGAAQLSPPSTVTDLFAIAARARLMISGDTGPLHVAAAVGTPIVGLFGPTDPARNGPWNAEDVVVSRFGTCACPYQRRCRRPTGCMADITVDDVVAAVERRIARTHG